MREIDEVRITLLRLFRGAVRLPDEIIDEMLKAFLHTRGAAIKVQAYGRGLLQRFRSHRLITKDFNRQASKEYQEWLEYRLPHTVLQMQEAPMRFARDHHQFITKDYEGINAKWYTRAHRESRKALAYHFHKDASRNRHCLSAELQEGRYAIHGQPIPCPTLKGVFGWLQGRYTRFVKRRLNWRAHRSRLGVKLLDFSSN
eukprot:scaffold133274_cov104-Phaeocystis_antarctica.AAC.2